MNLYPHQAAAINRWTMTKRHLDGSSPGAGKTIIGAAGLERLQPDSALVVCPAMVRWQWIEELGKWYNSEFQVIKYGRKRKLSKPQTELRDWRYQQPYKVISYDLLPQLLASPEYTPPQAVIMDEVHALSNVKTKQTRAAAELIERAEYALGLSATLIPNQVDSIWGILETMWPGRFGSEYQFKQRYMQSWQEEVAEDKTVWKYKGLHPVYGAELRERMEACISRTTREEIAHLLPDFDMRVQRVDVDIPDPTGDYHEQLRRIAAAKVPSVVEWVNAESRMTPHICVLTYHQQAAEKLAAALSVKHNTYLIHGQEATVQQRLRMIDHAKQADSAVLVATMKSIGTGVDSLTFFTQALFAEMYSSPRIIEQAVGRFSRISSEVPSSCTFMIARGSLEEVIATRLEAKYTSANQLQKATDVGTRLESMFGFDEQELADALERAAASADEEDYF